MNNLEYNENLLGPGSDDKIIISPEEGPGRLPIGFYDSVEKKFYKGFEVTELDADVLTSINQDQSNIFRTFGTLTTKGLIRIFDFDTNNEPNNWKQKTSKLFFPDIFFLMVETLIKTKGSSYIATVYRCPECQKFTKYEDDPREKKEITGYSLSETEDVLTSFEKEDMRKLKFTSFDNDEPILLFQFKQGIVLNDIRYTDFIFRIPEIGDYISETRKNDSTIIVERRVLLKCLVALNNIKGNDLEKLKSQYQDRILKLKLPEYNQIIRRLNSIGYHYQDHLVRCSWCNYEYTTMFDLTNFFGSILRT